MNNYPLSDEIPAARYFLDFMNNSFGINLVRCVLILVALIFIGFVIRIKIKKNSGGGGR